MASERGWWGFEAIDQTCENETYISEHVLEPFGLPALALCAVGAGVFGIFLEEMEKEFVVWKECWLGIFDLGLLVMGTVRVHDVEVWWNWWNVKSRSTQRRAPGLSEVIMETKNKKPSSRIYIWKEIHDLEH
jgi:hypothetical protein